MDAKTARLQELLQGAIDLLEEADAVMQHALGASEETYDLHSAIQDVVDRLQEKVDSVESDANVNA